MGTTYREIGKMANYQARESIYTRMGMSLRAITEAEREVDLGGWYIQMGPFSRVNG